MVHGPVPVFLTALVTTKVVALLDVVAGMAFKVCGWQAAGGGASTGVDDETAAGCTGVVVVVGVLLPGPAAVRRCKRSARRRRQVAGPVSGGRFALGSPGAGWSVRRDDATGPPALPGLPVR